MLFLIAAFHSCCYLLLFYVSSFQSLSLSHPSSQLLVLSRPVYSLASAKAEQYSIFGSHLFLQLLPWLTLTPEKMETIYNFLVPIVHIQMLPQIHCFFFFPGRESAFSALFIVFHIVLNQKFQQGSQT